MRNVLVINGHPDPRPERFCAALCMAYREGAAAGGWSVQQIAVGAFAQSELECDADSADALCAANDVLIRADRLMVAFPLWLDQAPMILRHFLAKIVAWRNANCPATGFALPPSRIRTVVTMEMPAFAHRTTLRGPVPGQRAGLALPGLELVRPTFIGSVRVLTHEQRLRWLHDLRAHGQRGT